MDDLFDDAAAWSKTYEPPERPPYTLMSMDDLRSVPWNGLTAAGSFSGCGGSSTGLRMAGFRVPVAIEFIPEAARTYRRNSSSTIVIERDIRTVKADEILGHLGMERGELDLFEGSPPCSSWSSAGNGQKTRERPCEACSGQGTVAVTVEEAAELTDEKLAALPPCSACKGTGRLEGESKKYSDSAQKTDDLFEEYVRLVGGLHPRAFLAENVPGLLRGADAKEYVRAVTTQMSSLGYRVHATVMNSASFGAATSRERLIFVGIRDDVGAVPSLPARITEKPYTVREALAAYVKHGWEDRPEDLAGSWMTNYAVGRTWEVLTRARDAGTTVNFGALPCSRCGKALLGEAHRDQQVLNGLVQKAACLGAHAGEKAIITKNYFSLTVPDPDKPCPTITATGAQCGAASVTHPLENRKFTPREAAVISGFPYDFALGSVVDGVEASREPRYERVGRAVTPPLYRAVGEHIAGLLGVKTA